MAIEEIEQNCDHGHKQPKQQNLVVLIHGIFTKHQAENAGVAEQRNIGLAHDSDIDAK